MTLDTHDHTHGPGCGHTAIRHGDHVDYLHDGELHHHGGEGVEACDLETGRHAIERDHERLSVGFAGAEKSQHPKEIVYEEIAHSGARRAILPRASFLTTTSLIATRGCHNRCGFCYLATDGLRMPYRMRDPAQVAAEFLADTDDSFTLTVFEAFELGKLANRIVFPDVLD